MPSMLSRLEMLIRNRDRYIEKTGGGYGTPVGANSQEWLAWRRWVDARRAEYAEAIAEAREEKRFNQRSKANERRTTNRTDGSRT